MPKIHTIEVVISFFYENSKKKSFLGSFLQNYVVLLAYREFKTLSIEVLCHKGVLVPTDA